MKKNIIVLTLLVLVLVIAYFSLSYYYSTSIGIKKVNIISPENSGLKVDISIELDKKASVFIKYWKHGSSKKYTTPISENKLEHNISLLLLEPGSQYEYKIIIDKLINIESGLLSFSTREASPWMVHDWIKEYNPHDEKALGGGLIMLCYRGYPGYIAMVDGKGVIRWYWQDEKLGVRHASLTPRNTIIALLAPARKDEYYASTDSTKLYDSESKQLRTGKIGFVGGTEIAEINLKGDVLWRLNINDLGIILHHDIQMNKRNEVLGIYRDPKMYDLEGTELLTDTLWGDGIMVMDTTGRIVKKWSAWNVWDISKDKKIKEYSHDRFHFNTLSFDIDSNYIISSPIENQIWKVNATSGEVMWKLGENGDFKMDSTSFFHFQHASHINKDGHLMLFDNGDFSPKDTTKINKQSRALSFNLDTSSMKAITELNITLPKKYYTSRMGSSYFLTNNNILHTSSKTGTVVITDINGHVLWELNSHFIPYQAKYIPPSTWSNFIKK